MWPAGKREPGVVRGYSTGFQVRPMSGYPGCGQCRWLQSSLRVSPEGPGPHGAGPRQKRRSGGINQGHARAAGRGGGADTEAISRLAAGQERLLMPPALAPATGGQVVTDRTLGTHAHALSDSG